jgi:hypothetical protein
MLYIAPFSGAVDVTQSQRERTANGYAPKLLQGLGERKAGFPG